MGKINILSEELCNRIAAGEVIDRPYSVVKELVENSIDAGATEIEIYIERGGKDLIKIIDNGSGIEKDDMRTAFIPHATSKITQLDDIEHIHTLGFRGEALATISSVAYVELISSIDGVEAYKVLCDGEFIGKVEPAVAPKGTSMAVRNLFFNTPVRFKFMKTDKKEESDITAYVTRFILGNPDIAFKYYVDGKLVLQSYGGGLDEAITKVYGANYLPQCFKISADRNDIKINGFIGNQNFFKSNKTYQNIYLNGRYINNPVITSAITNAYAAYAMKRQYPFFVLFIQVPDDIVDVNVHPNKQDVRFVDNQVIYGTIYKVISSILDGTASAANYVIDDGKSSDEAAIEGERIYAKEFTSTEKLYDSDFSDVVGIEKYQTKPKKEEEKQPYNVVGTDEKFFVPVDMEIPDPDKFKPERDLPVYQYYRRANEDFSQSYFTFCSGVREKTKFTQDELIAKAKQEELIFNECKYKGTLFNTYIIYEMRNEVYVIDQHAAHERLLYDKLIEKINNRKVAKQGMLIPYIFVVTPEEKRFLEDNVKTIFELGFSIDPFGFNSFKVCDIPADLPNINLEEFFKEFLSNVGDLKKIGLADVLKEKLAQTACKHAIKGGETLTEQERDTLFAMLKGNLGLKCPHGRPICVRFTKTEIEKMFKRKI